MFYKEVSVSVKEGLTYEKPSFVNKDVAFKGEIEADDEGQTSTTGENPASPSRETPRYPLRSIRSKDGTGLADNENGGDIVEDEVGS